MNEVTFVISSLSAGGAQRVCATLANGLSARGWRVCILVVNDEQSVHRLTINENIVVDALGVRHVRHALGKLMLRFRRIKPEKVLVFNHQLALTLVALRVLNIWNGKIIARNISTLTAKYAQETSWWHKHVVGVLTTRFFCLVDLIVCQSRGMQLDLVQNFSVPERKTVLIRNPLPDGWDQVAADVRSMRVGSGGVAVRRLVYVGRLDVVKDIPLLLHAVHRLTEMVKCAIELDVIGDGPLKSEMMDLAGRLGLDAVVNWHGYRSDPREWFDQAEVTLLTSRHEGFPNVLVESMARGTPVVSVDCPSGPAEVVVDGMNGLLVRSRDPGVFARAICQSLDLEWNRDLIRESVDRFNHDVVINQYAQLLLEP